MNTLFCLFAFFSFHEFYVSTSYMEYNDKKQSIPVSYTHLRAHET